MRIDGRLRNNDGQNGPPTHGTLSHRTGHKFQIGQAVELRPALSRNVPGGIYVVTKQLPEGTGELEYRVKGVKERHEADQSATSPLRSRPRVQMLRHVVKCRQPPLFGDGLIRG